MPLLRKNSFMKSNKFPYAWVWDGLIRSVDTKKIMAEKTLNHHFFFDSEYYSMTGKVICVKKLNLLIENFKSSRFVFGESYFDEENHSEYVLPFECVKTASFIDVDRMKRENLITKEMKNNIFVGILKNENKNHKNSFELSLDLWMDLIK